MKKLKKGSVDYEIDKYGRKIRKYVVTKMVKIRGHLKPIWEQDVDFKAETKIHKHKVDILTQRW